MSKVKQKTKFDYGVLGAVTQKLNTINDTNDSTIDATIDTTNLSTIDTTKDSTMIEITEVEADATIDSTIDDTTDSTTDSTMNATNNSTISITIKKQENYLDKHVQRALYIRKDLDQQLNKISKKTKVAKSELVNMALELLFENLKIEG